MNETPCEVHEMPWCGICNGDLARQIADQATMLDRPIDRPGLNALPPGVTAAEFPARCAGCRDFVDRGDLIRYSMSDHGWVGLDCCG